MSTKRLKFEASSSSGSVSAILLTPPKPKAIYVFGHGAGAGMEHPFMVRAAIELEKCSIASLRYNFPYMEEGRKGPNPPWIMQATTRSAVDVVRKLKINLPILMGGKSMGGRMSSMAAGNEKIEDVQGLIFYGFPLHAPGKDGKERAEHLFNVDIPMLFMQGTRDKLADFGLMQELIKELGDNSTLFELSEGDHSFKVPKSSDLSEDDVHKQLGDKVSDWLDSVILR